MKDILEYSKQAPNDYPFVYQDTMERVFAEDLNKVLKEYEEGLLENISKFKDDYNLLKDDVRYRTPNSYIRFYDYNDKGIKDLLFKTFSYTYRAGGQQAYRDFNKDESFKLSLNDLLEVSEYVDYKTKSIKKSYKNLITIKLMSAVKSKDSFDDFYSDLEQYRGFKKRSEESYVPPMPNRVVLVDNFSTREISRGVNNGRLSGYNRTRRIMIYLYKTRLDERVSTICSPRHNEQIPPNQAKGVIPQHRNCRCTLVPHL